MAIFNETYLTELFGFGKKDKNNQSTGHVNPSGYYDLDDEEYDIIKLELSKIVRKYNNDPKVKDRIINLLKSWNKDNGCFYDEKDFIKFKHFICKDNNDLDWYYITLQVVPYTGEYAEDYICAIEDVTSDIAKDLNSVLGNEFKCKIGRYNGHSEDGDSNITIFRIKKYKKKEN